MDAQATLTVGAAVTALVQFLKWSSYIPDRHGPAAVLILAAIGTAVWAYSAGNFGRVTAFEYFAGWISVALTAAGIFGFTRAGASAVTALREPPAGAAQNPTTKP